MIYRVLVLMTLFPSIILAPKAVTLTILQSQLILQDQTIIQICLRWKEVVTLAQF